MSSSARRRVPAPWHFRPRREERCPSQYLRRLESCRARILAKPRPRGRSGGSGNGRFHRVEHGPLDPDLRPRTRFHPYLRRPARRAADHGRHARRVRLRLDGQLGELAQLRYPERRCIYTIAGLRTDDGQGGSATSSPLNPFGVTGTRAGTSTSPMNLDNRVEEISGHERTHWGIRDDRRRHLHRGRQRHRIWGYAGTEARPAPPSSTIPTASFSTATGPLIIADHGQQPDPDGGGQGPPRPTCPGRRPVTFTRSPAACLGARLFGGRRSGHLGLLLAPRRVTTATATTTSTSPTPPTTASRRSPPRAGRSGATP